jgi:APA family basic amino acid/polyamine antiporter
MSSNRPPSEVGEATQPGHSPRRELGLLSCIAMVVGNIIGMGIFVIPASLAPYRLNAMIGWAVTIIGCLALSVIFSRLAQTFPNADGPYGYIKTVLGTRVAYIVMWVFWVGAWATESALATGVVGYLVAAFPALSVVPPPMMALILLWLVAAVNSFGVKTGGSVQVVTSVLKLVPLVVIVVLGAVVVFGQPYGSTWSVPTTTIDGSSAMSAVTITLYAMLGIESATIPASRVRNPAKNIPRATMIGTIVAAAVYVAVSAVPMLLIAPAELAASSSPLALVASHFMGDGASRWLDVFVVISGLGALNGWTLVNAEVTRTMADNHVLPAIFKVNNAHGSPIVGLLVNTVFASLLIIVSYEKSMVEAFTFYTKMVATAELPMYLCATLALGALCLRGKAAGRRTGTLVAAGIAVAYVIVAFIGAGYLADSLLVLLIVVGLALYWIARRRHGV